MSAVKRVAPEILFCIGCNGNHREPDDECGICLGIGVAIETAKDEKRFIAQCLHDLAAGRHAKLCGCEWTVSDDEKDVQPNACSEIVRCALEMHSYDVEAPDEVPR